MTPTYHEVILIMSTAGNTYELLLYRQPTLLHLVARAMDRWDNASHKLLRRLDKPFHAYHKRHCECEESGPGVCTYMPLDIRQELLCFELAHRRRTEIANVPIDADLAHRLEFPLWKERS